MNTMDDLQDNVAAFLRVLDPRDNSTGGGTASAVAGAMAAALAAMVARLSLGREGMEPESWYRDVAEEGETLCRELFRRGREDSQAFDLVMAAFRMPKSTEEEKAARTQAIAKAMLQATEVPMGNAEKCLRVLELCGGLKGRSNPNAASDLESAQHLARAGLLGCLANVAINLPGVKDAARRGEIETRAEELRREARSSGE